MSKCRIGRMKQVFSRWVVVNIPGPTVTIWTDFGILSLSRNKARIFLRALLDDGVKVRSFWKECTQRERDILDPRIQEGRG
jgi:hypothetical protein